MGIFRRRDEESMDPQEFARARPRGHGRVISGTDRLAPWRHVGVRLTVADVFMIRGRGTVVAGMVETGVVRIGLSVLVERAGEVVAQTVVAGIEKFRDTVDSASAGDNVGLLVPDSTMPPCGPAT